ncbi:hypothetical protein [Candidatus Chlorohelix sp.]|uniref:hypothetical protein n=1 Tax=Candidatus Chlorohelix sp. TaxID=3139201 RepID=UPI0031454661
MYPPSGGQANRHSFIATSPTKNSTERGHRDAPLRVNLLGVLTLEYRPCPCPDCQF